MSNLFILSSHKRPIGRIDVQNAHFVATTVPNKKGTVNVMKNRIDGITGEMPVHRAKLYIDILLSKEE